MSTFVIIMRTALEEFLRRIKWIKAKEISAPKAAADVGTPWQELHEDLQAFLVEKSGFHGENSHRVLLSSSEGFQ